jgi:hypothetical protein
MARNATNVAVTADEVFALLLDPYVYPQWVVGTKRIRAVDDDWPREGASFHHSVGIGPLTTRDSTKLVASTPPTDLRLEVRFRPLGVAAVSLTVSDAGAGCCTIVLHEVPVDGPVRSLRGRAFDAIVHVRNALCLRRLRRLAERHAARHRIGAAIAAPR